ncbi:MAG: hypothetical protein KDD56_02325 [Bdellovibrionales bacterium]|nr:hypothetical protein [Bdellovibrionales bacterium]
MPGDIPLHQNPNRLRKEPSSSISLSDPFTNIQCKICARENSLSLYLGSDHILTIQIEPKVLEEFFNRGSGCLEIESKFKIEDLPSNLNTPTAIQQAYLVIEENANELRIRSKNNSEFLLSVKVGKGRVRQELTLKITEENYKQLVKLCCNRVIEKNRFKLPLATTPVLVIEIDEYLSTETGAKLAGLVIAEIEFPNTEIQNNFDSQELLKVGINVIAEVTEDSKYSNQALAASKTDTV